MKKTEVGKWVGYALIAAVLLIEVPRFLAAFRALDRGWFGVLTAFGTAVALSGGSMYVFHTWWKSSRKMRNWLLVPFGANLALAVVILLPWAMSSLRGVGVLEVMAEPMEWAWALVAVASPFILMGGVTTALAFQKEHREKADPKPAKTDLENEARLDESEEAIIRAWTEHPDPSFQSVADALGMAKSTLYGKVQALERQGVRVRGGNHR